MWRPICPLPKRSAQRSRTWRAAKVSLQFRNMPLAWQVAFRPGKAVEKPVLLVSLVRRGWDFTTRKDASMKTKAVMAVLALAGAAFALPAAAQMSMSAGYVGGGLGQSKFKADCGGGLDCDKNDTSFRGFVCYQFPRHIAVVGGDHGLR